MANSVTHIHALERRLLTVLFVDIVRSSDLLRKLDIEEAGKIFHEVISRQIQICSTHGGTVNQVMGDGLLCLFGAEAPYEDHAFRALAAAESMLEDIRSLQQQLKRRGLRIRIGINSGEVILQPSPEPSYRSKYQVLGEAVHIADRILKAAKPNTALLSESTRRLTERFHGFSKVTSLTWGDSKNSIQLYRKTSAPPTPIPAANRKIIRRVETLDILQHMTGQPEGKDLRITWIQGEAGFGKTFISRSLIEKTAGQFFKKIIGINFYPHPVPGTHRLESEILKNILPGAKEEWPAVIRENPALQSIGTEEFILSCVYDVMGLIYPDTTPYHGLDRASRAKVRRLVACAILRQFSSTDRTLIVFEDMHWAREEERIDIENMLGECANGGQMLQVLCTSRTDAEFGKTLRQSMTAFKLRALSADQSQLLLQCAGATVIPRGLAKTVCDLSGGNPYFVLEYALWIRSQMSRQIPLPRVIKEIKGHTPEEVVNILYAKLGNLDKETIDLVRTASIQGLKVNPAMLSALSGVPPELVRERLKKLQAENILHPESEGSEIYTFSHELLHKVIYNSITKSTRLLLHKRALHYLRISAQGTESRRLMAYHAGSTNDPLLQYICSKWAAREAGRLSRHTDALEFLNDAKKALARLKPRTVIERHLIRLKFYEIESFFITGRYESVRNRLEYVLARKDQLPGIGMLKEALSFQGLYFWINGEIPKAERTYLAILKANQQDFDKETHIRESARLSHVCVDLGQYRRSVRHAQNALQQLSDTDPHSKCGLLTEIGPTVYSCLAQAYAELGDQESSSLYFSKARTLLADSQDYFTRIYTSLFLASSLMTLGDTNEAQDLLKSALGYCSVVQSVLLKPYALSAYGLTIARQGQVQEGIAYCAEALEVARDSGLSLRRSLFNIWFAEAMMIDGKHAVAMKYLRRAIKYAAASNEKGRLAHAHYLMAECYNHLPATDDRSRKNFKYFYQKALSFAEEEDARPLQRRIQDSRKEVA
jgi:class 3 adenylate cyclase/predicted ATPase